MKKYLLFVMLIAVVSCSSYTQQQDVTRAFFIDINKLFYNAVKKQDLDAVRKYVKNEDVEINKIQSDDITALYRAVIVENFELVKILVEAGADVNKKMAKESQGTPLMEAAYRGNLELVKYLVSKGADVNAKNYQGYTVLDVGSFMEVEVKCKNRQLGSVIRYLLSKGAETSFVKQGSFTIKPKYKKVVDEGIWSSFGKPPVVKVKLLKNELMLQDGDSLFGCIPPGEDDFKIYMRFMDTPAGWDAGSYYVAKRLQLEKLAIRELKSEKLKIAINEQVIRKNSKKSKIKHVEFEVASILMKHGLIMVIGCVDLDMRRFVHFYAIYSDMDDYNKNISNFYRIIKNMTVVSTLEL